MSLRGSGARRSAATKQSFSVKWNRVGTIIPLMLNLWRMEGQGSLPLQITEQTSLDAATRTLPGGFYTTFRTYAGRTRVLGLKSHLGRLYRPARRLGIQPAAEMPALRAELASRLAQFPAPGARVRLILTLDSAPGDLYFMMEPLQTPPPEVYRDGVRVVTTQAHRDHPALKTTGFIEQSRSERSGLAGRAAYEGLLVDRGRILEGLTSNFFYVMDGILGTARRGVLNGVTRRGVLKLAEGQGIPISFRALRLAQLPLIDEAFLTSSSRGIVPIVAVDGQVVGAGGVGEVTKTLMQAYAADIVARAEPVISNR